MGIFNKTSQDTKPGSSKVFHDWDKTTSYQEHLEQWGEHNDAVLDAHVPNDVQEALRTRKTNFWGVETKSSVSRADKHVRVRRERESHPLPSSSTTHEPPSFLARFLGKKG